MPPVWLDVAVWLILASFLAIFAYMARVAVGAWRDDRQLRRQARSQQAEALIVTTYARQVDADTWHRHLDALHRIAADHAREEPSR